MCSVRDNVALPTLGFPIRASAGHRPFSASPRLIAAVHALLRLLVPRHPPCALTILTVISVRALRPCPVIPVSLATVQFSRSAKRRLPADCRGGLSKLNSMPGLRRSRLKMSAVAGGGRSGSVDVLGPTVARAPRDGTLAPPGRLSALPRKEVIQPQLPLRLPCYDFTPVTSPTFDSSLPCGLGHRLRVLLTPVV